jgi:hypothetical protein
VISCLLVIVVRRLAAAAVSCIVAEAAAAAADFSCSALLLLVVGIKLLFVLLLFSVLECGYDSTDSLRWTTVVISGRGVAV